MTPIGICPVCGLEQFLSIDLGLIPFHKPSSTSVNANARTCSGSGKLPKANAVDVKHDPVNHPSHYTSDPSGVECIEVSRYLNFNVGNAFKYVFRAGDKLLTWQDKTMAEVEDLEKALFYIKDEYKHGTFLGFLSFEARQKMMRIANSREGAAKSFFNSIYLASSTSYEHVYKHNLLLAEGTLTHHIAELKAL